MSLWIRLYRLLCHSQEHGSGLHILCRRVRVKEPGTEQHRIAKLTSSVQLRKAKTGFSMVSLLTSSFGNNYPQFSNNLTKSLSLNGLNKFLKIETLNKNLQTKNLIRKPFHFRPFDPLGHTRRWSEKFPWWRYLQRFNFAVQPWNNVGYCRFIYSSSWTHHEPTQDP